VNYHSVELSRLGTITQAIKPASRKRRPADPIVKINGFLGDGVASLAGKFSQSRNLRRDRLVLLLSVG
jgi:hypothetical protein